MRRPPASCEIVRRADQQAPHLAEAPRHHARIRKRRNAQRQIEAAADQVDDLVARDAGRSRLPDRRGRNPEARGRRAPGRTTSAPPSVPGREASPIAPAPRPRPPRRRRGSGPLAPRARARSRSSDKRREVRWNRRSPRRPSSRATTFETVALERSSSLAARAKEPASATLAKIGPGFEIGELRHQFWKR